MRKLYIISFILFIFTALMSAGFFHEDEHFQLVEFANYKMGNIPSEQLPWEFKEQMRPTFQVFVTYSVFSVLKSLGMLDPFDATIILRIIVALLSFIALYAFFNKYKYELKEKSAINWFAGLTFFLWYIPFVSVRFSSESFATIFMLLALCYYPNKDKRHTPMWKYLMIGICLGLSFISRYQMGFMIIGLGLWILFIRKDNIRHIGLIFGGFIISFGIGLVCDYWFYGNWVLSSYNYIFQNLVENKAAEYGVSPIWFYALQTPIFVFPLFGVVIIPCLIVFFIKYPKHLFTWALIPFIVIHHIIGHKEMRFMFPLIPFIPFIVVIILQKFSTIKYLRFMKYPFWVVNILALIVMSCKPAYDNIGAFKYLYRNTNDRPVYFIGKENPFRMWIPEVATEPYRQGVDLTMHFYYRDNLKPDAVKDMAELDSVLTSNSNQGLFVFRSLAYREKYAPEMNQRSIHHKPVYNTYHWYFRQLNWGNWMAIEDIGVWTIVEVDKRP